MLLWRPYDCLQVVFRSIFAENCVHPVVEIDEMSWMRQRNKPRLTCVWEVRVRDPVKRAFSAAQQHQYHTANVQLMRIYRLSHIKNQDHGESLDWLFTALQTELAYMISLFISLFLGRKVYLQRVRWEDQCQTHAKWCANWLAKVSIKM